MRPWAPTILGLLLVLVIGPGVACGEPAASPPPVSVRTMTPDATAPPAPVATATPTAASPPEDPSARLFDQTGVHAIFLEVAPRDLVQLRASGLEERVRARLTFDRTVVDDVGLRLKGGWGSFRTLDAKASFSIDTDEFVDGQALLGVTRLTLGNAVQDPSFVAESIAYEVFRSAGAVAPRTAYTRVHLNGELFGLYVMREGYDKRFLRRTFERSDGNLYEASLWSDIADVEYMQARTNESRGDRSDLGAVAAVVAETPPERYITALAELVDLDSLLTYWAVEVLVRHRDGYAVPGTSPNNYYFYHDPSTNKFVFLAHGADESLIDDPAAPVLAAPSPLARMATRLFEDAGFRERLRLRVLQVLDRHWDAAALDARVDQLAGQVRANGLGAGREETTIAEFEQALADRRAFIATRAASVRSQLGAAESGRQPS